MEPDKRDKDEFVVKVKPGMVVVQAFKTSDGTLFETYQKAKEHEDFCVLKQNLSKYLSGDDMHLVLSYKDSIFKDLTAYYKTVK